MDDSDQESRTASVGSKRRVRADVDGEFSSGTSTPKKSKSNLPAYHARASPRGSVNAMSVLPPQLSESKKAGMPVEISDDSASSRGSSAVAAAATAAPQAVPVMNWSSGANNVIRTSLRGNSALGKPNINIVNAPLPQPPIGFDGEDQTSENESSASSDHKSQNGPETSRGASVISIDDATGTSQDGVVSISDDSDLESGDDGGIMLNMETRNSQDGGQGPLEIADDEDRDGSESGEIESSDEEAKVSAMSAGSDHEGPSPATQAPAQTANAFQSTQIVSALELKQRDLGQKTQKLGDLNSDELESQLKYAYFHMKSDELDAGRPVICLHCFEEGHLSRDCGLRQCEHCGERDKHRSQFCPKYRRCLKCRERCHDKEHCTSKLKDTTVPCDFCKSSDHLEDSCPMVWMYSGPAPQGPVSLNISCANCASKTHLIGDCPALSNSKQYKGSWSLQDLDPSRITNLTLQPDQVRAEKILGEFGPKRGLRVKGRADPRGSQNIEAGNYNDFDKSEDDDQFFRAPVNRAPAGRHIRFGGGVGTSQDNDRSYRPDSSAYDSYQPDRQSYRDRRDEGRGPNSFDYTRPRSRSPPLFRSNPRGLGDHWQPPLPREPPPPSGRPPRKRGRNKPGVPYRPLPSAGKKNWDRYRSGG